MTRQVILRIATALLLITMSQLPAAEAGLFRIKGRTRGPVVETSHQVFASTPRQAKNQSGRPKRDCRVPARRGTTGSTMPFEWGVGLEQFRDQGRVERLPWMLLLPFWDSSGDYAINRRGSREERLDEPQDA